MWENCVWGESIGVNGRDLYLFQAIHQQSDVIPENVDAVRALSSGPQARKEHPPDRRSPRCRARPRRTRREPATVDSPADD